MKSADIKHREQNKGEKMKGKEIQETRQINRTDSLIA